MLNIQNLIDDAKCYETVRELRWPEGVRCAHCGAEHVTLHQYIWFLNQLSTHPMFASQLTELH